MNFLVKMKAKQLLTNINLKRMSNADDYDPENLNLRKIQLTIQLLIALEISLVLQQH